MWSKCFFLVGLVWQSARVSCVSRKEERVVRVWRGPFGVNAGHGNMPEQPFLAHTPSTGLCLSGGGSRAYTAAFGALRALHDLDLLKNVRYIAGVSGGAWATAAFSYSQLPVSDEILLGPYWDPEDITLKGLEHIDDRSARAAVSRPWRRILLEEVALDIFHLQPIHRAYERALSRLILEPLGVTLDSLYTWNNATKKDIVEKNPSLKDRKWITPTHNSSHYRPYPIIETTMLGPFDLVPFKLGRREFFQSEMTPLYVGRPHVSITTYVGTRLGMREKHIIGGLIEPIGYGGSAPQTPLEPGQSTGLVTTRQGDEFSIARFIAQSSWNFASLSEGKRDIAELFGGAIEYWSPAAQIPKPFKMDIADGGDLENIGLMSMIRRRVERIVVLENSPVPLVPRSTWNPHERLPHPTEIDSTIASYFGIFTDSPSETSWNYRSCQIFASDLFSDFAARLQDAQASGRGAVLTTKLTTIANHKWGIPAGITAEITWVYLSRMREWEKRLPQEVADVVVPMNASTGLPVEDPSHLQTRGAFKDFPQYPTSELYIPVERANLLASLAGASVRMNEATFQKAFGLRPMERHAVFV